MGHQAALQMLDDALAYHAQRLSPRALQATMQLCQYKQAPDSVVDAVLTHWYATRRASRHSRARVSSSTALSASPR